jgi:hypothetical protein
MAEHNHPIASSETSSADEGVTYRERPDTALHEVIEIPEAPEVLAQRNSDGIDVTLLWYRSTDRSQVSVMDAKTAQYFTLEAGSRAEAADMYKHPLSYRTGSVAIHGFNQDQEAA